MSDKHVNALQPGLLGVPLVKPFPAYTDMPRKYMFGIYHPTVAANYSDEPYIVKNGVEDMYAKQVDCFKADS